MSHSPKMLYAHLERLYKGIEKNPDTDAPSQQLDQPGGTKQLQESNLN